MAAVAAVEDSAAEVAVDMVHTVAEAMVAVVEATMATQEEQADGNQPGRISFRLLSTFEIIVSLHCCFVCQFMSFP